MPVQVNQYPSDALVMDVRRVDAQVRKVETVFVSSFLLLQHTVADISTDRRPSAVNLGAS